LQWLIRHTAGIKIARAQLSIVTLRIFLKRWKGLRMLESIVELLGGLLLSALPLLIGSCIVGSIIAALRAVSGGT